MSRGRGGGGGGGGGGRVRKRLVSPSVCSKVLEITSSTCFQQRMKTHSTRVAPVSDGRVQVEAPSNFHHLSLRVSAPRLLLQFHVMLQEASWIFA